MAAAPPGRTPRDLRRSNRITVLRRLYFDGPASRVELAGQTGLSAATVTNVVADLLAAGLVVEAGQRGSDGGRPAVVVQVDPDHRAVVGVDVGEGGAVVEVFDLALGLLARVERPRRGPIAPPDLGALIADGVREALADAGLPPDRVLGVGVGVPGIVEYAGSEILVHAPSLGWSAVRLGGILGEALGLPVHIDNGAKTMGRAEAWFGAGSGAKDLIVVLIGTGVGAGIVTGGEVYRGTTSSAGEWGHTTVVIDGDACRCGAAGCLEAYVGAPAILTRYATLAPRTDPGNDPGTDSGLSERAGLDEFVTALDAGSPAARTVLAETARYLGVGIGNLLNLFNPERIIIGGWLGLLLGDRLLPLVVEQARRHALRPAFDRATVELCRLGPDAVALGAATLVVEQLLNLGGGPSSGGKPGRLGSRG